MLFPDLPQVTRTPAPKTSSVAWQTAVAVLVEQGSMKDGPARTFVGRLKKQKLSDQDLLDIANAAIKNGTLDPRAFFAKAAAETLARRRTTQEIEAPTEARQRAWMEEWKVNPNAWRRHERGPAPGEPGCRISRSIQEQMT